MTLNNESSKDANTVDVKVAAPSANTDMISTNPWNKIPPMKPVGKNSLASIIAHELEEQEKTRIASDAIFDEEEISPDILNQIQSLESEEERMMRLAIEASLKDSSDQNTNDANNIKVDENADKIDHDMELAIKLSLQDANNDHNVESDCKPSHIQSLANTNPDSERNTSVNHLPLEMASQAAASNSSKMDLFLTKEEEEQIRLAILEADDAEAARSLKLALELQAEEDRSSYQAKVDKIKAGASQSNIRFVTKAELEEEANDQLIYERKIYSHRDVHVHSSDYIHEIYYHECEDNEYDMKPMSGYQMNSTIPSSWSRSGRNTIMKDNEVRTKHDVSLKNKVNAEKLLGSNYKIAKKGGDLAVSDKAYNSFNQSLKNSLKRSVVKGVERSGTGRAENISEKTRGGAMDSNVRLLITKAINNGLIQHCNGVVKEGKEAIVYHADAGTESEGFDVAVKVFKRISEFRNRGTYIDNDPRYFGQKFSNADSREQVELWAEKEYRNLVRANRAGISVPTPLLQRENVLFLRFLGDDGWPAPQLRELELRKGSKKWTTLYCQTLVAIRRLFHCARLIHGDLSEYNILVCSNEQVQNALDKSEDAKRDLQVVLIDFGQAVERNHPSALDLLKRDLQILNDFFLKQEITILEQEECEDFVTREFEGDSSNTEDEDNDLIVEDDTLDGWRHTPKDWNDQKNFEWVYDRLQQMNLVSR